MNGKNLELRYLCLVHRHGDRAPIKFLPDDPNVRHWPDGPSNLTNKGKAEMYNLGVILRKRYDSFLGDKFFCRDVYVRSTDVDRCLTSAQCCLAGLFPTVNEDDKFSPKLNWQPIPVHTLPDAIDPLAIRIPIKHTHPVNGAYEDPLHNKIYQTLMKQKKLYNQVDTVAKCNSHFKSILMAIDTILIEMQNNLTVPSEFDGRLDDLKELFFAGCHTHCVMHIESHLTSSSLLNETVKNMEEFMADSSSTPKTFIYSLHDFNVIGLIAVLTKAAVRCPTASCLIFELYEDIDSSEFYIKILFLNKHNKDPLELKFNGGHDLFVSFKDFKNFVGNFQKITEGNRHLTTGEPLMKT